MAKFLCVSLLATLMLASSVQGGLHDLKNKLFHRYPGSHGGSYAGASASAYTNGNAYSGASAAASAGNGYRGGNAAASAAASTGNGYRMGNSAASAAASVQNNVYAAPAPAPVVRGPPAPVEPQKPAFDINAFKAQNNLGYRPYLGPGGVGASAAAAAGAGNSASAAAAASGSYEQGGYYAPGSFAAASGTFAQSKDNGFEQRHSSNEVDNMENHEMGRADDDHYYNAKSYGKAADEQEHVNYNKNFEDIMSSPTVYHSVKSNESLLKDHNKSQRETGSAVEAKDHHSAGYQKHQKHFHQKADSGSVQSGAGGAAYATENDALNHNMEDEDEMYFDSDGLQGGQPVSAVGMATNYGQSAGASSAVRGAFGGSAASSAALSGGYNAGRFGNRFGGSAAAAASVN